MSYLVGNPEDRFCRVAAHLVAIKHLSLQQEKRTRKYNQEHTFVKEIRKTMPYIYIKQLIKIPISSTVA